MPFVSRIFEGDDGPVAMWLFAPSASPSSTDAEVANPPWRCEYRLDFPDGSRKEGYAMGVDGMQAMLLAIASAAHRMHYVANGTPERRSPVRWLGSDDLGLTINHHE